MLFKCFKFVVGAVAYTIVGVTLLGMLSFGFSLGVLLIRNAIMGLIG